MSDQPKRECHHDLSERETMCADGWCPICLRSALHEADKQLAAERERGDIQAAGWNKASTQLADEREESAKWRSEAAKTNELRQQLSAEREKVQKLKQWHEDIAQQLAAEVKYREQVRDSLNKIIEHQNDQLAAELENYQRTVTDFLKCHAVELEEGVKALAQRSFELHECQKQVQRLFEQLVGYRGTTASGATPP